MRSPGIIAVGCPMGAGCWDAITPGKVLAVADRPSERSIWLEDGMKGCARAFVGVRDGPAGVVICPRRENSTNLSSGARGLNPQILLKSQMYKVKLAKNITYDEKSS